MRVSPRCWRVFIRSQRERVSVIAGLIMENRPSDVACQRFCPIAILSYCQSLPVAIRIRKTFTFRGQITSQPRFCENGGASVGRSLGPQLALPGGSLRCSKSSVIESAADEKCSRRVFLSMIRSQYRRGAGLAIVFLVVCLPHRQVSRPVSEMSGLFRMNHFTRPSTTCGRVA
jgi:hypothetical protein